jgi:hypothetical protein
MAANVSYQRIREQLINLSVDLEDKSKLCQILEQKTRDERKTLGLIEAKCEEKFLVIIEVTSLSTHHKDGMNRAPNYTSVHLESVRIF